MKRNSQNAKHKCSHDPSFGPKVQPQAAQNKHRRDENQQVEAKMAHGGRVNQLVRVHGAAGILDTVVPEGSWRHTLYNTDGGLISISSISLIENRPGAGKFILTRATSQHTAKNAKNIIGHRAQVMEKSRQ